MSVIAILSFFEMGHMIPSLSLGEELREEGHEIVYLVIEDMAKLVQDAGFSATIIFPDIYPLGTLKKFGEARKSGQTQAIKPHLISLLNGALDQAFNEMKPDLLLIDYVLTFEALIIHYSYSIKQVFFSTMLPEENRTPRAVCMEYFMGLKAEVSSAVLEFILKRHNFVRLTKLDDVLLPIDSIPELILCPEEFEIPGKKYRNKRVHYIGPYISSTIKDLGSDIGVLNSKKSLFVSFGSQNSLYSENYKTVINVLFSIMRSVPFFNFHLTVTLGNLLIEEFPPPPSNVTMIKWVNQHRIVARSSLVITHGGLGTIKECLYFGVPMIVIPMTRDQPGNAFRVEQHNLGKSVDINSLTTKTLEQAILDVLTNEQIKNSVSKMKYVFRQKQQQKLGCQIISDQLK